MDTTPEELREDDVMQMTPSEPGPDNEGDTEEAGPENRQTLDNLAEGFDYSRLLLTSFMTWILLCSGTKTKANGGRRIGTIQKRF